jgi:hypothetical protein
MRRVAALSQRQTVRIYTEETMGFTRAFPLAKDKIAWLITLELFNSNPWLLNPLRIPNRGSSPNQRLLLLGKAATVETLSASSCIANASLLGSTASLGIVTARRAITTSLMNKSASQPSSLLSKDHPTLSGQKSTHQAWEELLAKN